MTRLERWQDAFALGQRRKGLQCLVVGGVLVTSASARLQIGVFRADRGIIQTRADAMGVLNLPIRVLPSFSAAQRGVAPRRVGPHVSLKMGRVNMFVQG